MKQKTIIYKTDFTITIIIYMIYTEYSLYIKYIYIYIYMY